ncbi:hypothetical protein HHI36_002385 [Cryptolaemus montrouzieri]|uniref:Uncharacterized protein n=1 Tax=Cryptolaemus montrouzieri TaxID=559131 RepID=A0ABD2PAA4_9CUCU
MEVALVMLIIPFFVNILMFWVTDNFLMYRDNRMSRRTSLDSFLQRSRLRYRSIKNKFKRNSESDILLSGDDELLADELNHNMKMVIA